MPLPVLERVERRRVRYWRRRAVAATLTGLLATGGALAWQLRSEESPAKSTKPAAQSPPTSASAPTATVEVTPPGPTEEPALLVRQGPLASHTFTPPLGANGAILVDGTTGTVLWGRNAHERLPIASTTKIMTAVLTLEHLRLEDEVVIRRGIRLVEPFRRGAATGRAHPGPKAPLRIAPFFGERRRPRTRAGGRRHEPRLCPLDERQGPRARTRGHAVFELERGRRRRQLVERLGSRRADQVCPRKATLQSDRGHANQARHLAGPDVRKGVRQQEPPFDDVRRCRRREDRLDDQGEPLPGRFGAAARHSPDRGGARVAQCLSGRPARPRFR